MSGRQTNMATIFLPSGEVLEEGRLEELKSEAKRWVRRMLEGACIPAGDHAEKAINEAIAAIVAIYIKHGAYYGGNVELDAAGRNAVEKVLDDLKDKLYDLVEAYAKTSTDDSDRRLWLVGLYLEEYKGLTLRERITIKVDRIRRFLVGEIEKDAMEHSGVIGTDVAIGAILGVKSAADLVVNEVKRGWMEERGRENSGARYVHVFRGSSYDCPLCDSVVAMGWQPVGTAVIPPLHNHCCCYTVYV